MQSVLYEYSNGVGIITLNRPNVLNSFTIPMAQELHQFLKSCESDKKVRAIYLTGAGRAFCAGQDLEEAIDPKGPSLEEIVTQTYNPTIKLLRNIGKPIICGVNGVAAGAGANIAFACDVTFAISSASFIQAFSKIGLIPDSGGTYTLPRLIGLQKATGLCFSAEKIGAKQAEDLGLIYKALENDDLTPALEFAKDLAQKPTQAFILTKKLFNASWNNNLETQLELEKEYQAKAGKTEDYKEGVNAFLEKRQPIYKGK